MCHVLVARGPAEKMFRSSMLSKTSDFGITHLHCHRDFKIWRSSRYVGAAAEIFVHRRHCSSWTLPGADEKPSHTHYKYPQYGWFWRAGRGVVSTLLPQFPKFHCLQHLYVNGSCYSTRPSDSGSGAWRSRWRPCPSLTATSHNQTWMTCPSAWTFLSLNICTWILYFYVRYGLSHWEFSLRRSQQIC